MKTVHFPVTVVDDFFDYPDSVRNFALSQEYNFGEDTRWPGKRSKHLHELNFNLYHSLTCKIMSLFYDLRRVNMNWSVDAFFQTVDSVYENGWIHSDLNLVSGVIYLSKESNNSGTTIYRPINPIDAKFKNEEHKNKSYENIEAIKNFDSFKEENNKQFKPSITVESEYNRLVMFDGHMFHGGNNFYGKSLEESRLTLVFFVKQINFDSPIGHQYPIPRLKTYF